MLSTKLTNTLPLVQERMLKDPPIMDVKFDPITGSMSLDNGIYKGLHRQVWCIRDERPSGVDGGTFQHGSWTSRHFSTIDGMSGMGVSLKDETTILIEPGTYIVDIRCPALGVGFHQIRFYNATDKIIEVFGTSASSHSDEHQTTSEASFHLSVFDTPKEYQIQHCCSGGRPNDGFGKSVGFKDSMEVYSILKIQKVL